METLVADLPALRRRVLDHPAVRAVADWLVLGWRTVRSAVHDDFGIAASSIAFAAFLALVPLVGLVAATYGLFVPKPTVAANLAQLTAILPPDAQQIVVRSLRVSPVLDQRGILTLVASLGVALFSARRAGRSMLHGINFAYWNEDERRGWRRQVVSTLLVLGCAGVVLTALVSLSVLALLQSYVPDGLPGTRLASTVILLGSLTLGAGGALILIYRYAVGSDPVPWSRALPGTIAGVAMWLTATLVFRGYVAHVARFDNTYGSLSAVAVLMLWLLVSAWTLLLGARLNAEVMRAREETERT